MTTIAPCHKTGKTPNRCAAARYEWHIYGNGPLYGRWWSGWRIAGRELVSPDGQRVSPERLRGLLFRQDAELRIVKARAASKPSCKVLALPARERFDGYA